MDYRINTTTERLNSTGGIALAGKILEKIEFGSDINLSSQSYPDVLKSMIGLYIQGRTRFEEIDLFRKNIFFRDSLGLGYVPAKETARLYLERMIPEKDKVNTAMEKASIMLLKNSSLNSIKVNKRFYLLVDIDIPLLIIPKAKKKELAVLTKTSMAFTLYSAILAGKAI
ncbi:MAG: hypothetical protein GY730_02080 [bacterium]|nr:hypothetical protein [bacterium]